MTNTEYALITGGSSGIGEELANCFAPDGISMVLVARNTDELLRVKSNLIERYNVDVIVKSLDLTKPGSPEQLFRWTEENDIKIEYLVNNAGYGDKANLVEADIARIEGVIRLNVEALVKLSRLYGKTMAVRGSGRILNIASMAGFVPGPGMAVYYASKAFVLSFSQAISIELQDSGVSVTAICPGPTKTKFATAAGASDSSIFKGKLPSAKEVASFSYEAMKNGELVAIWGWRYRLATKLISLVPRRSLLTRTRVR